MGSYSETQRRGKFSENFNINLPTIFQISQLMDNQQKLEIYKKKAQYNEDLMK